MAWLGLALQPCVMAAAEDNGCPGCPPGMDHGGALQHTAANAENTAAPCAVGFTDCMHGSVYSHDARGAKAPPKAGPGKVPNDGSGSGSTTGFVHAAAALLDTAHWSPAITRDRPPDTMCGRGIDPGSPPPRNLLFCVHLK